MRVVYIMMFCPAPVTINNFLFQSDIIHQSVMELIHSEDREEFKRQLTWNSMLPTDKANLTLHEVMMPGN